MLDKAAAQAQGPTPHGVGGLKFGYPPNYGSDTVKGPTPHGVGGLKLQVKGRNIMQIAVPPHTGWVD